MPSLHCKNIRNRPKSDLSRNPQLCYFALIFYAVLDSTDKYPNHCTAQNRSEKFANLRNPQLFLRNPEQFVESTNK